MRRKAQGLIAQHWPWIEAVALALIEKRKLRGCDLSEHLDDLRVMDIPVLEAAKSAVWFYHGHVVAFEVKAGELAGIPADSTAKLTRGYEQCLEEAEAVVRLP